MSRKVNLNAYFERIGFAGSIAPNLATLELIHALHPAAIPFENLNPLLGLPVLLDQESIEQKLLAERRGGYCFEHNLLLMRVLKELDFSVRGLAARSLWLDPHRVGGPLHHMVLAIELGGTTYIADVGFGGLTLTAPLKLRAELEQATPHETFRLTGGDPEWRLEARIGDDWRPLYGFELNEQSEEDYEEPNRYRSSDPGSNFTRELVMALSPKGQRIALSGNRMVVRAQGEPAERRMLTSVADFYDVFGTVFGLEVLPPAELLDPALQAIIEHTPPQAD